MSNIIEFPVFGIGPFGINPVALDFVMPFIGWHVRIAWYGIFVTLGILSGIFYAFWRGQKNNGIAADDMIDVAIFSIPAAIIGARLYYVLFSFGKFDSFYKIIAVWNGGLAVYGAIIFGFLTGFIVCKVKKLSILKVFDSGAPAIMLGQIIGRWGNFTNAEAFGVNTGLPWGMSINGRAPVHPIFLYECLWNLVGFIIINLAYKFNKKKFDGQIFLMYITWYGFGRMLIEGIRGEDTLMLGSFRVSQIVGFLCFVVGTMLILTFISKYKLRKLEEAAYEGVYAAAQEKLADGTRTDTDDNSSVEENFAETDNADVKSEDTEE
ncbi:MAG: prolipoprotein diacylglyceryl transferase [Oscillospiraceae bacterium]|nr:prolipoprotein diacylglyceryl transferase [Oscillospiraceae bacterium]